MPFDIFTPAHGNRPLQANRADALHYLLVLSSVTSPRIQNSDTFQRDAYCPGLFSVH
ncbi:hypothetical protein SAMN05443245_7185 [Paraburkholderia fungorum]|uniref:Uncharacterized protein n=1 Tax=Paraburkholderia fungorum TaxID=134537 RepID=A0A1H1JQV8_9BURK|nr:hypothetical protein SAMN05443245_7185 [Paraburkholderia fungorum]